VDARPRGLAELAGVDVGRTIELASYPFRRLELVEVLRGGAELLRLTFG
jgi:hypothetical protein